MKVVTNQSVQQESCGHYITLAEKGEELTVISEGVMFYTVTNKHGDQFTVGKHQVETE